MNELNAFPSNCIPTATSQLILHCVHVNSCNTLLLCAASTLGSLAHHSQLYHDSQVFTGPLQPSEEDKRCLQHYFCYFLGLHLCQRLYDNVPSINPAHLPKFPLNTSMHLCKPGENMTKSWFTAWKTTGSSLLEQQSPSNAHINTSSVPSPNRVKLTPVIMRACSAFLCKNGHQCQEINAPGTSEELVYNCSSLKPPGG